MKPATISTLILITAGAALASLAGFTAGVMQERERTGSRSDPALEHELLCTIGGTPTFEVDGIADATFHEATSTWAITTETMLYRYVQAPGEACGLRSGRR